MIATFKQGDTLSDIWENCKEMKLHVVLFRVQAVWKFLRSLAFLFRYPSATTPISSAKLLLTQGQMVAHKVTTVL
jgi:hypothetical protein